MTGMTQRLSPADAAFLYADDAALHVGGLVILQPNGDFDYQSIVRLIGARLALVPRYRQKVRFVPGRLARPVWVDDDSFDLTYHVRRSALPRPGSDAQLEELVGRLISRPLDRSRPLWEMYIVEGLAGGRIALINKTHHAMVDRVGAVDVAAAILDVNRRPRKLPTDLWIAAPAPSDVDLVVDAIADMTARPSDVLDLLRLAALDIRSTAASVADAAGAVLGVVRRAVNPAPQSVLSPGPSGQRRFSTARASLSDFKAIRAAHGGSVNDVILAVLSGALRSWMLSRGEPLTDGSTLRAMVPMSVRPESHADAPQVTSYLIDLPVAEPSPVMRLNQVSFAMGAHLESGRQVGADALLELGRFAPPTLHALGARVGDQLSRRSYDVLITNAPGPQVPLYAAGIPVIAMYPVAPLAKHHALALSCTSYRGSVYFGMTAAREAMPDGDEFAMLVDEAVSELMRTLRRGRGHHRAGPGPSRAGPR